MKSYQNIEKELKGCEPGWWERICGIIPELGDMAGTPQPRRYHAEGDVAEHTRLTVSACPDECDPDLLWAALLHDVGKPLVTKVDGGNVTSHGHHNLGAEMAERILGRLGMPAGRRGKIVWAVRHHTFHLSWNLKSAREASGRHRRFLKDPRVPLLLELLRADSMASIGNPRVMSVYELYLGLWKG